jgi:hypothetical protein
MTKESIKCEKGGCLPGRHASLKEVSRSEGGMHSHYYREIGEIRAQRNCGLPKISIPPNIIHNPHRTGRATWDHWDATSENFTKSSIYPRTIGMRETSIDMDATNVIGTDPRLVQEDLHMRLATHEKSLEVLAAERAQLVKQLETWRAERQVLEAVARKLPPIRRSSPGGQ